MAPGWVKVLRRVGPAIDFLWGNPLNLSFSAFVFRKLIFGDLKFEFGAKCQNFVTRYFSKIGDFSN
jgi:hypothetical protein